MGTTVSKPGHWLSQYFPNKLTDRQIDDWVNVWWRIGVVRNISPTDSLFEYMRDMGSVDVDNVLFHKPLRTLSNNHVSFFFPERHMTTPEEQLFVSLLYTHPQISHKKMTIVDIVTKSPLIVGNFLKDDVRIISRPEEEDERGKAISAAQKARGHLFMNRKGRI